MNSSILILNLPDTDFLDVYGYGKFTDLIRDYLTQEKSVQPFFNRFPTEENLILAAQNKIKHYKNRNLVYEALVRQLSDLSLTDRQIGNLKKFKLENTVTVTTGHQLNLMTGPLYFFYKILQTIKCCEFLEEVHPDFHFVPIFWMATEDHDFEEINHFFYDHQKFSWDRESFGAVGRLNLEGLDQTFQLFLEMLPETMHAESLKFLIQHSYGNSIDLRQATKQLVQDLFEDYGLLMIDGDDSDLKRLMIPKFEEELVQQTGFQKVTKSNDKLSSLHYNLQVHPREINLFYLSDTNHRDRIVYENGVYQVLNQNKTFSQSEILNELNHHPERFSPNVILRPLYQETILPNIAYIGGSGEISYWLQLKSFFESQQVPFPVLIVRNSVMLLTPKQKKKLEKLNVSYENLMLPLHELVSQNISEHSDLNIDFEMYRRKIESIFDEIHEKSTQTDLSFSHMVNAQRQKQLNGLDKMQKRLIRAENRKYAERKDRIEQIYHDLFPGGNLQERQMNFSQLWVEYGSSFIEEIYKDIQPFDFRFVIKNLP